MVYLGTGTSCPFTFDIAHVSSHKMISNLATWVISVFRRDVDEICAVLGHYAADR